MTFCNPLILQIPESRLPPDDGQCATRSAADPHRQAIRNPQSAIRNPAGYILLETMVSLVIVAVGLTSVLEAFGLSRSTSRRTASGEVAVLLAQQKLEEVRSLPGGFVGTQEGDFGPANPQFAWRCTIDPVEGEKFHSARVEVTWTHQGRQRSVSLGSLMEFRPPIAAWKPTTTNPQ